MACSGPRLCVRPTLTHVSNPSTSHRRSRSMASRRFLHTMMCPAPSCSVLKLSINPCLLSTPSNTTARQLPSWLPTTPKQQSAQHRRLLLSTKSSNPSSMLITRLAEKPQLFMSAETSPATYRSFSVRKISKLMSSLKASTKWACRIKHRSVQNLV